MTSQSHVSVEQPQLNAGEPVSDAMAAPAGKIEVSPELATLLDANELRGCLETNVYSNVTPFESEESYHSFLHFKISLQTLVQILLCNLAAQVTKTFQKEPTTSEGALSQLQNLNALLARVEALGAARLAASGARGPRIERLMAKYGIQGQEREVFLCCFVMQALKPLAITPLRTRRGFCCASICNMSDFDFQVMMDKDRMHVREGCLMASSSGWQALGDPLFTKEALHMLMLGNKLPTSSSLTLSTTKMLEVLEEEAAAEKRDLQSAGEEGAAAGETNGNVASEVAPVPHKIDAAPPSKRKAEAEGPPAPLPPRGEERAADDVLMTDGERTLVVSAGEGALLGGAVDEGMALRTRILGGDGLVGLLSGMSSTALPPGGSDKQMADLLAELRAAPNLTPFMGKRRRIEESGNVAEGEKAMAAGEASGAALSGADSDKPGPYTSNLEYLDDRFQLLALQIQLSSKRRSKSIENATGGNSLEYSMDYFEHGPMGRGGDRRAREREMEAKHRMIAARIQKRLEETANTGSGWKPRLLALVEKLELDSFEENVVTLLVAHTVSPIMKVLLVGSSGGDSLGMGGMTVNQILTIFCETFEEQVNRRTAFYKKSKLVQSGVVKLGELLRGWGSDLMSTPVEVDRRTLDFVVGLDRELDEVVDGSHLYWSTTDLSKVVLPTEHKDMLLKTISSFEAYAEKRAEVGLEDTISYGAGLVILFCGPSGTGKTMSVNGLANHLKKRVLLVNLPSLGASSGDLNFRWLFREAKVNDAVLFFDECESLFETRDHGAKQVNVLLTEMERHRGIIFLATNRPYDLDEAMHRRITLVVEFQAPDHLLRIDIWKALIPPKYPLTPSINWSKISLKFELTGGFIKNAIISSLLIAIGRDKSAPIVTEEDLIEGCKMQLRGSLRMRSFHRRIIPKAGLESMVFPPDLEKRLIEIAHFDKARQILFGQWGFNEQMRERQGISALFHGPPGTGKTNAAECLGFEIGKPLKFVNCGELVNKYVGETGKNIDKVFEEAKLMDAVLVFDEAEGLFGSRHAEDTTSTARYANIDVGILLHHLERFPGVVILITNTITNVDKAFYRRLKFVLEFPLPDASQRTKLWKSMIPAKVPLSGSIDYDLLGQRYDYAGGSIASAVFRAAARAALRPELQLRMEDLVEAAEEEKKKEGGDFRHTAMYL